MENITVNAADFKKLVKDVEMIKMILMNKRDPEGELSDWAKNQLKIAREAPASDYVSHEEVKRKIQKNLFIKL